MLTAVAVDGPLFVITIVKTAFCPVLIDAGEALCATAMSDDGLTMTLAEAVSFAEFGSAVYVVLALRVIGEAVPAVATSITDAVPAAAIEATVQLAVVAVVVHVAPEVLTIAPPLSVNVSGTAAAASGPALLTVIVNVPFCPALIDAGALTDGATSEASVTVTLAVAVLFVEFGSNVDDVSKAVAESVPTAVAFNVRVTLALAPTAMVPIGHVTGPVPLQGPAALVAETNDPPVNVLSREADGKVEGPLFVTVIVNVAFWPFSTEGGPAFVTAISAEGLIGAFADAESLVAVGSAP